MHGKAGMMQAFTSYEEICLEIEMFLFLNNNKTPLNKQKDTSYKPQYSAACKWLYWPHSSFFF